MAWYVFHGSDLSDPTRRGAHCLIIPFESTLPGKSRSGHVQFLDRTVAQLDLSGLCLVYWRHRVVRQGAVGGQVSIALAGREVAVLADGRYQSGLDLRVRGCPCLVLRPRGHVSVRL